MGIIASRGVFYGFGDGKCGLEIPAPRDAGGEIGQKIILPAPVRHTGGKRNRVHVVFGIARGAGDFRERSLKEPGFGHFSRELYGLVFHSDVGKER